MEQLRVRKIITEKSGNIYWLLFEDGKMKNPIALLNENEITDLGKEITEALDDHNILRKNPKESLITILQCGERKIQCIKILRNYLLVGLKEAKDISEGKPHIFNLTNQKINALKIELDSIGCKYSLK